MSDTESLNAASGSESSSVVVVNGFRAEHENSVGSNPNVPAPQDDAFCIVGMACRLPGDISSPSDLWQFLVDQKSAQGTVPAERYNIEGFYHPAANRSGSMNVPGGYFIQEDVRQFDNNFFGVNNLEATYMDPQQRKLLQVVYECLQSSGTTMESLSGSSTGVFVANFSVDFQPMQARDPDYIHRYQASGSGATVMSNRISHVLNLQGPSFTVDTACSSSIYALHQAVNALKAGDCESAIVASANLIMSPEPHIGAAKSGVLSPTGTCHTFDSSADGYGRAEGVNAIYVKRLSAALRDGNPIRAIIKGSAVNASGRTPGISLPSGNMQEVVIRKAYRDAGLDFADTDYVECHGTGTPVGDPIEVDAIGRCFSPRQGPPLIIGSVKTNVGHSEGASGLTSIIKVVKSMEEGRIAPSYGVKKLNPKLILEERNLKVATQMENWPRALRRASINSFGYGGANAHVILESADSFLGQDFFLSQARPQKALTNGVSDEPKHVVLPVSAGSANSLKKQVEQISQAAKQCSDYETLQSLAHTLSKGRDELAFRGYLLASIDAAAEAVELANTETADNRASPLPFGFVFTGQGAQHAGMAKELLSQSKHFLDTIRGLDKVLQALPAHQAPAWTLEQTLLDGPETSKINDATRSQPICTAVQIGLVDLLRSYGVQPTAVVGHSSGEMAAAYAAGLLSSSQAILVAYFRGYAVGHLTSQGRMMAAGLGPEEAKDLLESKGLQAEARVACVNSPESVTLSGSPAAIDALEAELQGQKKFARKLETNGRAYHSHMMEEIGPLYEELLAPVFNVPGSDSGFSSSSSESEEAKIKMYSSVGHNPDRLRVIDSTSSSSATETDAAYWRQNLEQPVQFSTALASLAKGAEGKKIHLIEIGPHSALKGPIQQIRKSIGLDEKSVPYSSTLVRKEDASACLKTLAGALFIKGHSIDWEYVNEVDAATRQNLRTLHALAPYPWDYSAGLLWNEPRTSIELRNRKYLRHELLGTAALTGNGIDYTWRNCLRPNEMPWIKDHKLEDEVVFPAAGYMAMAIEAVSQITGVKQQLKENKKKGSGNSNNIGFELRNVNISSALVVPEDTDEAAKDLELHTTMSLRKISGANASADWHDFSISSFFWTSDQATVHCTGSIRVAHDRKEVDHTCTTVADAEGFDLWASTGRWYTKWQQEGLCFGPQFRSLTTLQTDSARKRREAIATAKMEPTVEGAYEFYPVHPITIDAGLQAACLSGTSGHVASLRTWLPVFFAEMQIQPPTADAEGEIHVRSEEMGFSSGRIDGTVRDASGALVVDFKDGRMSRYTGKNSVAVSQQQESATGEADAADASTGAGADPLALYTQRQPTLRIQWKPDVLRLGPGSAAALRKYVAGIVDQLSEDLRDDESLAVIGALLTLAGHKQPRMRVLEIGGDGQGYKSDQWLSMLDKETAFPRCRSWHAGNLGDKGVVSLQDGAEGPFDVVVIPKLSTSKKATVWDSAEGGIAPLLSTRSIVVIRKSEAAAAGLKAAGFDVLDIGAQVLLAVRPAPTSVLKGRTAVIVKAERASTVVDEFAKTLAAYLETAADVSEARIVSLDKLDSIKIKEDDVCVSLLETETEFLATLSPQSMDRLRAVTDVVADLLWVTGANMLGSEPDPNLTLSNGLSRAMMLEQPRLRWSVLDVGHALTQTKKENNKDAAEVAAQVCSNILSGLVALYEQDDAEFISVDGLLHVSRYGPDVEVNSLFRRRLDPQTVKADAQTLADANPARLTIGRPGVTDTMYFQQTCEPGDDKAPAAGFVDIEVKAVSLNAKDVYAMSGRVETRDKTTAFDFSGVVTAVGPTPESGSETGPTPAPLKVGDRVVAYAPFHIGTTARVPVGCVHPLLDHEEFTVVPTLLVVYATALYALHDRAHLRKGESVLVHAGSGGFGIAAITVAQKMGAVVYTTCGSQSKRDYLVNELGVPASHIFSSRDDSFVRGIAEATGGRGVDVILNSLVGDLMHSSWEACLADFGRFVEVGKRELIDAGRLDMRAFLKSATFTAFDLSELFYAKDPYNRAIWDRLMVDTLQLYRAGEIQPLPTRVFDITQVSQAYRFFGNKDRVGKVVISMEDPNARVPVAPSPYLSRFDADKVYLLVGCLGGLGRSLSRWMVTRGARNFVFLGRSGADRPDAKQLVTRLRHSGATVDVVRGDVCSAADVTAAVAACLATGRKIGGVVQAAMGLHEALFTRMTNEAWHTGIEPKWKGTWNLHNAIERGAPGQELDFFLLTSSISGTVGTATESNYCAANGFLDAFARWRRARGQACVSVGLGMISEVGYLHENPEIEALLLRKGIQPLNEDELLQVVDLALASEQEGAVRESHLLTGLEADGLRALTARGFDVTTHGVLVEARAALLLASLQAEGEAAEAARASSEGGHSTAVTTAAAPWFKDVPSTVAAALAPEAAAESMQEAILNLMKKRFSSLILLPLDQVDERKALPGFGVDSMIASEFRSWFWAALRVDVPFLHIMSPQKSLLVLAEFVEETIMQPPAAK
ncbi:Beta-ketoacyl synthase domain-containing protein [Colletotrichum higginsianum IMI 349063]|uniref:Beta-ketoacyl synthase domain-containing protein n=1 Tax=Colletotrichum higginsianum (strain IMI 349063) TaxID=759273 RepID=A0A1B7YI69_COLHI|nr:Beta-ketoacyl synthase domain-containing protein [Colletotrichum higginsianum IMI 349063]OBR11662.1 Beta-ketoacyl synthase domain-containing protein [Colletotrichum higginsianum IMI 349063]